MSDPVTTSDENDDSKEDAEERYEVLIAACA